MASGDNPDQPRQPRNLQGLLKFAMEATQNEDAPDAPRYGQMDEERRRFLEEALKSLTVDVVKELEKAMNVLIDKESDEDTKAESLEIVIDFVQDIDTANDFFKVGGFVIINPGLESPSVAVRTGTLRLIGALAQNNPFCQQRLLEQNILPKLTELLSDDLTVAQKAMYAISCMVRHYEPCLAAFIDIGGLECILGCLESGNEKLRVVSAFLMSNLCSEFEAVRDEFIKLNAVERVMGSVEPVKAFDGKLEILLSTLTVLTESKDGLERCRDATLKEKLKTIVEWNTGIEECQEQLEYAEKLLKRCFTDQSESTDR